MSSNKTSFESAATARALEHEQDERQIALEYLAEAWNTAEAEGLESRALAHASLFAALVTFVRLHGDESAAQMIADLPERIRAGEYNLDRVIQ